ncbi:hypothetical protein SDC9_124852 [bioreactor metagenome]|uniref:Uncharacterized protein n=1 Tax=bioreactor metagenome TaxID=1076179 RepID=A0A645CLT2_9ZZZZ
MHEDHAQQILHVRVTVDQIRHLVDVVDDGLGPGIAGGRLRAEDESGRGETPDAAILQAPVDGHDRDGVHQLAFVLVQALDLHVKQEVLGNIDALMLFDLRGQFTLFDALYADKLPCQLIGDLRFAGGQCREPMDELI